MPPASRARLFPAEHWDLHDVVAVVSTAEKRVSSAGGHLLASTSPLNPGRIAGLDRQLADVRDAIAKRDIAQLGPIIEQDALAMHAVMMTSTPSLLYWEPGTVEIIHAVKQWRETDRLPVYFTIDAGPNLHLLCEAADAAEVSRRVAALAVSAACAGQRPRPRTSIDDLMRLSDRSTFLLQSVLAVAALLVLAIGLRTFALREGGDLNLLAYFLGNVEMPRLNMPTSVTTSASPIPVNLLRIMVWVVLPITVIYAIVSPEYRRMVIRTALLIAGFLFVVNRLRANSAGEKEPELAGSGAGAPGAEQVLPAPPDFVTSTPQWFVYAIDVLIVLVVLLAAWFIWRRLRPRRQALPHEFAAHRGGCADRIG